MPKITQIIDTWCTNTIQGIIKQYDSIGLRASGNLAKSLAYAIKDTDTGFNVQITGADYIYYLVNGRKPTRTKKRGSPTLQEIILDWIEVKGIVPREENMTIESLSWAISTKIHKDGIKVPNEFNNGTLLDVINTKALAEQVKPAYIERIRSDIMKGFEKVTEKYKNK